MDEMTTPQGPPSQPSAQPPASPPYESASAPMPPVKPKTDIGFLLLGLFAPFVVGGILGTVLGVASSAMTYSDAGGMAIGALSLIVNAAIPLLFFAFLAAWMIGRKNGNVRLASFGKGGMWAYAVGALLALLAFGTCVIALGAGGL